MAEVEVSLSVSLLVFDDIVCCKRYDVRYTIYDIRYQILYCKLNGLRGRKMILESINRITNPVAIVYCFLVFLVK